MYRVARLMYLLAVGLAGCHVHPIHEDVTELSTSELVRKIQCEAADYIKSVHPARNTPAKLKELDRVNDEIKVLSEKANDAQKKIPAGLAHSDVDDMQAAIKLQAKQLELIVDASTPPAKKLAVEAEIAQLVIENEKLKENAKLLADFDKAALDLKSKREERTTRFKDIIGFEANDAVFAFTFTVTEANDLSAGATAVWPITLGAFTLGASLTDKRQRLGERKVNLVQTFGELNDLPCKENLSVDRFRSHRYPITGSIGLAEVFKQYLNVVSPKEKFGKFDDTGGKSFSDRIAFTTDIGGTLKPSISRKDGPRLLNANIDLGASRKDVHELQVYIRPVKSDAKDTVTTIQEIVIHRMPPARIVRMPP